MPVVPVMPAAAARPTGMSRHLFGISQVCAAGVVHIFDRVRRCSPAGMSSHFRSFEMPVATRSTTRPVRRSRVASVDTGSVLPAPRRRTKIDPTTCERDYQPEEVEFMRALEAYKRSSGRMFPTCSEILEVVRSLGYERVGE